MEGLNRSHINRSNYAETPDRPRNVSLLTPRTHHSNSKFRPPVQPIGLKAKTKLTTNMKLMVADYNPEEKELVQ